MKNILSIILVAAAITATAQVKVTQGSISQGFALSKQPTFTSFSTPANDFFVITRTVNFQKINTLIVSDAAGNIVTNKELIINPGVFNNNFAVKNLLVVGGKPYLFVENHIKDVGKNNFAARAVDNNGNVSSTGIDIGSLDIAKMGSPGDWYAAVTPDQKHVAVISISPYEKNMSQKFQYFMLDENLKQMSKGDITFPGVTKQIYVSNFLASDKGDLYIISEDLDRSYKTPMVYKYTPGGQPTVIPVMSADPDVKNMNYTVTLNAEGDLVMAGYMQKKKAFVVTDADAIGCFIFTSAKPNEVKFFQFDKPVQSLTARNIVYNGDTFYLIGEQYRADKLHNSAPALSQASLIDNYSYVHNDMMVSGFTLGFAKKFEITMNRKWESPDMDQDLMIASGVINGKLTLIYNDQYGKYLSGFMRKMYKLPVAVAITNDGLMEAPIQYGKELDIDVTTYKLLPQYFVNSHGRMILLSGNAQSVKTVIFD